MTKKDTIILAVLFNLVVLAGVLVSARQLVSSTESAPRPVRHQSNTEPIQERLEAEAPPEEVAMVFDEIDQLLEDYIADEADTPVQTEVASAKKLAQVQKSAPKGKTPAETFYTVKPGDNPWKIAKRFHLSFEKLLQLNHLDETKARNLKVGQQLKIKED
jgi:LysM repeat protein